MSKKFVINPNPTFKSTVDIPIHGGGFYPVVFEFKHRTQSDMRELTKWIQENTGAPDKELICKMIVGWDLDDAFTPENIALLCDNYAGAGLAIYKAYNAEIWQAKLGN